MNNDYETIEAILILFGVILLILFYFIFEFVAFGYIATMMGGNGIVWWGIVLLEFVLFNSIIYALTKI